MHTNSFPEHGLLSYLAQTVVAELGKGQLTLLRTALDPITYMVGDMLSKHLPDTEQSAEKRKIGQDTCYKYQGGSTPDLEGQDKNIITTSVQQGFAMLVLHKLQWIGRFISCFQQGLNMDSTSAVEVFADNTGIDNSLAFDDMLLVNDKIEKSRR